MAIRTTNQSWKLKQRQLYRMGLLTRKQIELMEALPDWKWTKYDFLSFEDARTIVHSLKLKTQAEWIKYYKSDARPPYIPSAPDVYYKNDGWVSLDDWLGHGKVSNWSKTFLPFKEARAFVKSLNLHSVSEWYHWHQNNKPNNLPHSPDAAYKEWVSWGDYLGTGTIASRLIEHLSFSDARAFVRRLKFQATNEWKTYCKSGDKPNNIPAAPWIVYKNDGWVSICDWLGTRIGFQRGKYMGFIQARTVVRKLHFKNISQYLLWWDENKPSTIPKWADSIYKDEWMGWHDFLGNPKPIVSEQRRAYMREWRAKNK